MTEYEPIGLTLACDAHRYNAAGGGRWPPEKQLNTSEEHPNLVLTY